MWKKLFEFGYINANSLKWFNMKFSKQGKIYEKLIAQKEWIENQLKYLQK